MAKSTTVKVIDDIDGTSIAEEVSFAYKGTSYVIDLGKKNASALEKALRPYLDAATRVRGSSAAARPSRRVAAAGVRNDVAAVRSWAAENGYEVNSRGRIPSTILAAYNAAKK